MDKQTLELASRVMEKSCGWPVRLYAPVLLKKGERCQVWRCAAESTPGQPTSVIVKQMERDAARGYSDWASLEFLSQCDGVAAPQFLGGNQESGFFLMEDLGNGEDLEVILRRGDNAEIQRAVSELAIEMARLCARTTGKESDWQQFRSALPVDQGLGRHAEADLWLSNTPKILRWFEALNCVVPSGFDEAMRFIHAAFSHPDQWLTFSHGDPAPSNNHFSSARVSLIDFEYGGFRHLLYDLTAWNVLCPLESEFVDEMKIAFSKELGRVLSIVHDDQKFNEAWATLCAYRALAILTWISPRVIEENKFWAGNWTMREAVLVAVCRMVEAVESVSKLRSIEEGGILLQQRLQQVWPEFSSSALPLPDWTSEKEV